MQTRAGNGSFQLSYLKLSCQNLIIPPLYLHQILRQSSSTNSICILNLFPYHPYTHFTNNGTHPISFSIRQSTKNRLCDLIDLHTIHTTPKPHPFYSTTNMTKGEATQIKVHYKGKDDDFIIFVDDNETYQKWLSDKSIPLAHFVSTFTSS